MVTRSELEQRYVNAFRNAWGTNQQLSTAKLKRMSSASLKQSIRSLEDFASRSR